jgi:hypothetical protein
LQFEIARALLIVIGVIVAFGTLVADMNELHVFNAAWPPHARFHCAAHALMNLGCGGLAIGLLVTPAREGRGLHVSVAAVLLAWSAACLRVALLFPGTSAVAGPREPVLRGRPVSLWVADALVLLTLAGATTALTA